MNNTMTLLERYIKAVQVEKSYVGGNGAIEDYMWKDIKRLQKELKEADVLFTAYEDIESTLMDWE